MPRKKVVHLIRTLEVGGCEMALLRMLPLTNDAFEHTIVTLQQEGVLAERFRKEGIAVITLGQHSLFDISSYSKLKKILANIHPDLLITHLLHADVVGRLYVQWRIGCKVISSIVTTYNFRQYWAARCFERLTKGIATQYMANSSSVKDTYVQRFKVRENKITVVPRGIDLDLFINKEDYQSLRSELSISADDRVIICVANLHINKGHIFLLDAFEKVFASCPNTKLLIVGTGKKRNRLLARISRYHSKNAVMFLGKRPDIAKLLGISHIFALPTFFEGMSNAIMEAMASGLPIVTTNIPENKELVTHEKTGLFCPVKDSDCLATMLKKLIEDESLAKELGENGRKEMNSRYNLNTTSQFWKYYFALMSQ